MMAPGSGDGNNVPSSSGSSNLVTDRRKILQQYLQELIMIPAIKESNQVKEFLDVRSRHPEYCSSSSGGGGSVVGAGSGSQAGF